MLQESFEKAGHWLFKWRSYLPIAMLGIIFLGMRDFEYFGQSHRLDQNWEFFCLTISFFGLAIRMYTIGYVPRGTSGGRIKYHRHLFYRQASPLFGQFLDWDGYLTVFSSLVDEFNLHFDILALL